jgi:hypothetical protein
MHASCNPPFALFGFIAVAAVVVLAIRFVVTGWAWGGRTLGAVTRADNAAGFWTAIIQYAAIAVVGALFVWFAFLKECGFQ